MCRLLTRGVRCLQVRLFLCLFLPLHYAVQVECQGLRNGIKHQGNPTITQVNGQDVLQELDEAELEEARRRRQQFEENDAEVYDEFGRVKKKFRGGPDDKRAREEAALARLRGEAPASVCLLSPGTHKSAGGAMGIVGLARICLEACKWDSLLTEGKRGACACT